jgi:hypothetical protein
MYCTTVADTWGKLIALVYSGFFTNQKHSINYIYITGVSQTCSETSLLQGVQNASP